jgi:hypothetical protein
VPFTVEAKRQDGDVRAVQRIEMYNLRQAGVITLVVKPSTAMLLADWVYNIPKRACMADQLNEARRRGVLYEESTTEDERVPAQLLELK